jgi:hypothetical protein
MDMRKREREEGERAVVHTFIGPIFIVQYINVYLCKYICTSAEGNWELENTRTKSKKHGSSRA